MSAQRFTHDDGDGRDTMRLRGPTKAKPATTGLIRTRPVTGVGRHASTHFCPRCGLRRRLCRCDED